MKTTTNIRLSVFYILLTALAITGCKNVDCCFPSIFEGSQTTLSYDGHGGPKDLIIICAQSWVVQSKPVWITDINPVGASGTVTFTAAPNDQPGTRKGTIILMANNGDKLTINVTQGDDPYLDFKNDATPRWEDDGAGTTEINDQHPYIYITDKGGNLFASALYKSGRITKNNGDEFEIIEFDDIIGVQEYTGGKIYINNDTATSLYYLEIIKIVGDKLWIVFKVNASDSERRIVQ
ncbi:MAG: BACON domain-containing protein [Bacteroidetes bacterium]|nr:BACON domain-containing protein [Bacteroidota bacterium]